MPDETTSIDPGELAILEHVKTEGEIAKARLVRDLNASGALDKLASAASALESSGLTKAIRDLGTTVYKPQMDLLQDTLKRAGEQALKLDRIASYKPMEMPNLPYVRPTEDYILEATRETSNRLDDVVEVLRETVSIQEAQARSLTSLYVSMEETTKLTRALLQWAPWGVAVGFGAMLAAIAAVVVPLFT